MKNEKKYPKMSNNDIEYFCFSVMIFLALSLATENHNFKWVKMSLI